jgi:hypothetical protein
VNPHSQTSLWIPSGLSWLGALTVAVARLFCVSTAGWFPVLLKTSGFPSRS